MSEREDYKTIDLIAAQFGVTVDKVRTIIARIGIQPRRFPDDLRKLYYSPEDVEKIQHALGK